MRSVCCVTGSALGSDTKAAAVDQGNLRLFRSAEAAVDGKQRQCIRVLVIEAFDDPFNTRG